ncbi:hypothetical protein [Streptomyces sannanensis]
MSEEKAEEWARHWTESMARTAKARIDATTVGASFTNCVGKNNESASDGRFTLSYRVLAGLPKEQHAAAVRAIRDALKQQGLEIQDFRSDPALSTPNLLYAKHPKDRHFIAVIDPDDGYLTLTVDTPCLLPPGAEQQQF